MGNLKVYAESLADFINDNRLNQPYGGEVKENPAKGSKKPFLSVSFGKPHAVRGEVRVYNPRYYIVWYKSGYPQLPESGFHEFKSADKVIEFLDTAFVCLDFSTALRLVK